MATLSVIRNRGLMTADNAFSGEQDGALDETTNCVVRYRDVLEPRRGQKYLGQTESSATARTFGGSGERSSEGVFYRDTLVIHYRGTVLSRDTGAAFSDYSGSFTPPDPTVLRMKFMEAVENLYFTSSIGPYVLDAIAGTPALAGVLRAFDVDRTQTTLDGAPGDGWFEPDGQVAYRVVWGIKDANGTPKYGWPSGRVAITNPATFTQAVGVMTIVGTGYVKVSQPNHGFNVGDAFTVSPGEAGIPAGTETVDGTQPFDADSFYFFAGGAPPPGNNTVIQTITSGNKNVSLRVKLPTGVTTSHYFRVYRSPQSALASLPAADELFLVYEGTITAGDITAGYVDVDDLLSEVLLDAGFPLYTNPNTGDGIESANARPPIAKDICYWQDRAWYINTTDRHRF